MLEVVGLRRTFDETTAIEDVTFSIDRGEFVVLIGPSGAGKTTLLRCLDGLEHPDRGAVTLDGKEITSTEAAMVFQEGALVEEKTALSNVLDGSLGREAWWREVLGWHHPDEKRRAIARLHEVNLPGLADRPVRALSGGERQRVGIARALHQAPTLVLADEPIASLDPETGRDVLELFASIIRENRLVGLVSLHQPDLATGLADRYLGLNAGRLVLDAPAHSVNSETIAEVYNGQ